MRVLGTLTTVGALLTLLSASAIAQEYGAPSDTPITTADCEQAWDASSASANCTTLVLEAESSVPGAALIDNCAVKANCAAEVEEYAGGDDNSVEYHFSDYHGGPEGVEQLRNCGGRLTAFAGHVREDEDEGC